VALRLAVSQDMRRDYFREMLRTALIAGCLGAGLVAFLSLAGCDSAPKRDYAAAREFPSELKRSVVLDVQVVRDVTQISSTNTSARAFAEPTTMWINRRFSRPIGAWGVGETLTIDLEQFRDNFGEQFRAGGFFSANRPDDVVLVELETGEGDGQELVGLVVVKGKAE
jgi:hypothetical protein